MKLRRVVYTSKATSQFNKRDLLDLLHDSRAYNSLDHISGVLIHKDGYFLQIIEGECDKIIELLGRLVIDKRHSHFNIISDDTVDNRLFSKWAMGCADFNDPSLSMIPGILRNFENPKVAHQLSDQLPAIANFLHDNLSEEQVYG
tara:strand:- start:6 stop:440 length:435 start_codon:yes stop_codon:yes gene_type:complete